MEIWGVVHFGSYSWISRPLPASGAGARGLETRCRRAAPVSVLLAGWGDYSTPASDRRLARPGFASQ